MSARSRRAALALLVAGLVLLSWIARTAHRIDFEMPGHDGWVTAEADSTYHMRRVARVFAEGLPVAERDRYMNPPEGAIIPWPPYYTLVACALLRPGLPADEAQRPGYIERGVASLPRVFATAATLVAFLAGALLAGPAGGVAAGATHALCFASIQYGRLGNGDHHAWIELLGGGFLLLLSWSLRERALARPRTAALYGAGCGALAGLMIGSWVAALLYLVYADLALAWLLVRQARVPRAGLGAFGLALHVAALLALAPAVWSSPWKEEHPWMVVNLSWFHLAYPALAALVFAPWIAWTPSAAAARRYPWIVLVALVALGAALFALDTAPARGIVEGFEWVSRADAFMADVSESVPAIGPRAPPASETLAHMGYGLVLLLPAWAWMAWRALARGDERMLPWVVALPPMVAQAAGQWTFTRALALPMAVVVGAGLAALLEALARRRSAERPAWVVPVALALAFALQFPTAADTARRARADWAGERNPSPRKKRALREAFDWLRAAPRTGEDAVMANWSFGHPIEWCADRPSVATNFGAYVGEECYRAPGYFFLGEDARAAEALLERHTARYVLVTSQDVGLLPALANTAPELGARLVSEVEGGEQARLLPSWYRTIGASLLLEGRPRSGARALPDASLDFLRLVHVSPVVDPNPALAVLPSPLPSTWIWERVPGATLEARAPAGTVLRVAFTVAYPEIEYTLHFERSASAGADGTVRLRVPYATVERNGDGRVQGDVRWELGARSGALELRDADVREGRVVTIVE
jgi:asparagine N-glycosylation enzyme membrane subunit Stt3